MKLLNKNQTINDILLDYPSSINVFMEIDIDLHNCGEKKLSEVLIKKGYDENLVIEKINASHLESLVKNKPNELKKMQLDTLSDYIIDVYHENLYSNLPKILTLIKTILRVHGINYPELSQIFRLYSTLVMHIEEHLILEEAQLFLEIQSLIDGKNKEVLNNAKSVIDRLILDHEEILNIFEELRVLTKNYSIPEGVCSSYVKMLNMLKDLEYEVYYHLLIENKVLFPKINSHK